MYSGNPYKKRWKGTTSRLSSDSWKNGQNIEKYVGKTDKITGYLIV